MSAIGSTRSQKLTLENKSKTKNNPKSGKSIKENETTLPAAIPAEKAEEDSKVVQPQSKSMKKTRAAKIKSK